MISELAEGMGIGEEGAMVMVIRDGDTGERSG